jgi:predicted ATPase
VESLLERQAELGELSRLHHQAARGVGRLVLLRGEAGVGKTAVIGRFIGSLDGSARVVRGWCDPLSAPRPLGPLVDMLPQLRGPGASGLADALDHGEPQAIYAKLLGLLGDGHRWVCVIEDAHWADGATLDLLRFMAPSGGLDPGAAGGVLPR